MQTERQTDIAMHHIAMILSIYDEITFPHPVLR